MWNKSLFGNSGRTTLPISEAIREIMSDRSENELAAGCPGVTEVNFITALGFYSITNSIESVERLERAHELRIALSVEVSRSHCRLNKKLEAREKLSKLK